jgi:hypothetical protein
LNFEALPPGSLPGDTPVSMTATITPAPWVTAHAASAFTMLKCHCDWYIGSFGLLGEGLVGCSGPVAKSFSKSE